MSNNSSPTLITRADLKELKVNYSNGHQLRLESEGKFPKRLYLSPARVAWVKSEVEEFIATQAAKR